MEHTIANQKPPAVLTAVKLLWTSLVVGVVKVLLDFQSLFAAGSVAFTTFVLISVFAVMGLLILKISLGRNWARITFLVLSVIGMLPMVPILADEFARLPLVGALSVVQMGLQGYALFLVFVQPGAGWFRAAPMA